MVYAFQVLPLSVDFHAPWLPLSGYPTDASMYVPSGAMAWPHGIPCSIWPSVLTLAQVAPQSRLSNTPCVVKNAKNAPGRAGSASTSSTMGLLTEEGVTSTNSPLFPVRGASTGTPT